MGYSELGGLLERIEERKRALGITSDQGLCRAAGLDPDYIRVTIRRKKEPGASKLLALARALQCSVSYLVEGRPDEDQQVFDERRMLDVLETTAAFAFKNAGSLTPAEFAELVVHLYRAELPLTRVKDLLVDRRR